jgi:hypothetical protein
MMTLRHYKYPKNASPQAYLPDVRGFLGAGKGEKRSKEIQTSKREIDYRKEEN